MDGLSMASKAGESFVKRYSPEERKKLEEAVRQWAEEWGRGQMSRDEKMMEDYNAEEMKIMVKENMLRMRRERLMRHIRTAKKKKNSKSVQDSESFSSDSDEEMKIARQEEVKRLMEKAIRENAKIEDEGSKAEEKNEKEDSKAEEKNEKEGSKAEEKEGSKAEEMNMAMFPRRRGRLIRYYLRRRQRSKSQDSDFQIEFHHRIPPEESSDDSST